MLQRDLPARTFTELTERPEPVSRVCICRLEDLENPENAPAPGPAPGPTPVDNRESEQVVLGPLAHVVVGLPQAAIDLSVELSPAVRVRARVYQ